MNIAIPEWLAPWLVTVGSVGIVLALILTIRAYIQSRRAGYYIVRAEARRTALRASLLVLLLSALTVGSLFVPRETSSPPSTPTATPTPALTPTPTRVVPTSVPTTTFTPQATATEPFIPTSTPQATLPAAFTSPLPSAVPAAGDARFEFWTLARGIDENDQPLEPSTEFPAGIERVYLFFRYDGLLPGVPWTNVWYRNGELVSGGTSLWQSERPAGQWHVFLEFAGGYSVGDYEVQVWLGDRLQIRAVFSVVSAAG